MNYFGPEIDPPTPDQPCANCDQPGANRGVAIEASKLGYNTRRPWALLWFCQACIDRLGDAGAAVAALLPRGPHVG